MTIALIVSAIFNLLISATWWFTREYNTRIVRKNKSLKRYAEHVNEEIDKMNNTLLQKRIENIFLYQSVVDLKKTISKMEKEIAESPKKWSILD